MNNPTIKKHFYLNPENLDWLREQSEEQNVSISKLLDSLLFHIKHYSTKETP